MSFLTRSSIAVPLFSAMLAASCNDEKKPVCSTLIPNVTVYPVDSADQSPLSDVQVSLASTGYRGYDCAEYSDMAFECIGYALTLVGQDTVVAKKAGYLTGMEAVDAGRQSQANGCPDTYDHQVRVVVPLTKAP